MSSVCGERGCARHTLSTGYGQGTWRGHIHTIFGLCWAFFNTHTRRYGIAIGRGLAQGARRGHVLVASPLRPSCAAVPPTKETNTLFTQTGAGVTGMDWPCGCSCPRRAVLARVTEVIAVVVAVARVLAALAVDRSLCLFVPFVPFVVCDNFGIA
jgi:hypothetical protein